MASDGHRQGTFPPAWTAWTLGDGQRMWIERKAIVQSAQGLHARPARLLWEKARSFQADVRIVKGELDVDGKSIFDIMTLDASRGTELIVRARGVDAEEAIMALTQLIGSELD